MNRRSAKERLADIHAAARDAAAFAAGLDEAAFAALPVADPRTYRALKNALAEIGEAVKLLPSDLIDRHPSGRNGRSPHEALAKCGEPVRPDEGASHRPAPDG